MKIRLSDEEKQHIKDIIHSYFLDERDEDIGIILQEGLLDLFIEEIAPIVYNKALDDAKWWFTRRLNDIESDYYEIYKEK